MMDNFNPLKKSVDSEKRKASRWRENGKDVPWRIYDSDIKSFDLSFARVLEGYGGIRGLIEREYSFRKGKLVAIELGGPGNKLFSSFPDGYLAKSAGFVLFDQKDDSIDSNSNHHVYEADILSKGRNKDGLSGYEFIVDWVKKNTEDGVDLIIERMMGGLNIVDNPEHADFFLLNICRWYKLLNEKGCLIAEVPGFGYERESQVFWHNLGEAVKDGEFLKYNLDVRYVPHYSIFVRKLDGAPEEIKSVIDKII